MSLTFEKITKNISKLKSFDDKQYILTKRIGRGSFGSIYITNDLKNNTTLATKVIPKFYNKIDEDDESVKVSTKDSVFNEVSILALIAENCQNTFLCFIDFQEDVQNYYIITEFLDQYQTISDILYMDEFGTDYNNLLMTLDVRFLLKIMKNIINGLIKLHRMNIVHRDISSNNIMFSPNGDTKFIDFGLSCYKDNCNQITETTYIPPEYVKGQPPKNFQSFKQADYWSLGVLFFNMICGGNFYKYVIPSYNYDILKVGKLIKGVQIDTIKNNLPEFLQDDNNIAMLLSELLGAYGYRKLNPSHLDQIDIPHLIEKIEEEKKREEEE